jgi:hypothetical protein
MVDGSLRAVWDTSNPIRANLFALAMREMVRNVLAHLAPDAEVRQCQWFQDAMAEKLKGVGTEAAKVVNVITRRDRMVYATQGGIPDGQLREIGVDTSGLHKILVNQVNELSKHVHVEEANLLTANAQVVGLVNSTLDAVSDFLRTILEVRTSVVEVVARAVEQQVSKALTTEVVADLDELSTHTYVDEVSTDRVSVVRIGPCELELRAEGTVSVTLNYGSESDWCNDRGASMDGGYPFKAALYSKVEKIKYVTVRAVKVDNSSFYK